MKYLYGIEFSKKISDMRSCTPECEKNSECNTNIGYCECKKGYSGNPYKNCLKKCKKFEDCPSDETCIDGMCQSPCMEDCGINALCMVKDHISICSCPSGYVGNAFEICRPISEYPVFCWCVELKDILLKNILVILFSHLSISSGISMNFQ